MLAQESAAAAVVTRKILPREVQKAVGSLRRRAARSMTGRDIGVREFMKLGLAENDRRRDIDDRRLVRPMFVPRLVRALTAVLGQPALAGRHRRSAA